VNGGGGAYLSIGTALGFPASPAVPNVAFYPSARPLRAKLEAETPIWKQPFWYWIKWFNAWPFTVESLSGAFDFNRAVLSELHGDTSRGSNNRCFSSSTASTDPALA
jgi:hypothetical protein